MHYTQLTHVSESSPSMWDAFVDMVKAHPVAASAAALAAIFGVGAVANQVKTEAQERIRARKAAKKQGAPTAQTEDGELVRGRWVPHGGTSTFKNWGTWTLKNLVKFGTVAAGVAVADRYTGTERSAPQLAMTAGFLTLLLQESGLGTYVDSKLFGSLPDPTPMDPQNRSILDRVLSAAKATALGFGAAAVGVASPWLTVPAAIAATVIGETLEDTLKTRTTRVEWRGSLYDIEFDASIMDEEVAQALVLDLFAHSGNKAKIDLSKPFTIVPYEQNGVGKYDFRDENQQKLATVEDSLLTKSREILRLEPSASVYHQIFSGKESRTAPLSSKGNSYASALGNPSPPVLTGYPHIKWMDNSCAFSAFVNAYILPDLPKIKASLALRKDTDEIAKELHKFVLALEEAHTKGCQFTGINRLREIAQKAAPFLTSSSSLEDDKELRDLLLPYLYGQGASPYSLESLYGQTKTNTHLTLQLPEDGIPAHAKVLMEVQENATDTGSYNKAGRIVYDVPRAQHNGKATFNNTPLIDVPMEQEGRQLDSVICHIPGEKVAHKVVLKRKRKTLGSDWYRLDDLNGNIKIPNTKDALTLISTNGTSLIYV